MTLALHISAYYDFLPKHMTSATGINVLPYSLREYSTFGGITGVNRSIDYAFSFQISEML